MTISNGPGTQLSNGCETSLTYFVLLVSSPSYFSFIWKDTKLDMLFADVPESPTSASHWRLYEGFHWRLHVHHRTRHAAELTVSIVRESNFSDVRIAVRLRLFADHLQKPVRNLLLASKESFPHERKVTVELPAGVASNSVKVLPIAVPKARFVVGLSLKVQECSLEIASQSRRNVSASRRSEDRVERFDDSYSAERSITWLQEIESLSELLPPHSEVTTGLRRNKNDDVVGETIPYNMSTLLESCNQGEQGLGQDPDTRFSDLVLNVGSGSNTRTFNLHRCILALASPVFRVMLRSEMLEGHTGTITLPTFTPAAVDVAVRHIYGSPVDVTKHAFELYQFGHQFDIVSLRCMARKAILQAIDLRSCVLMLRFGVSFRDEEFINITRSFIAGRFTELAGDEFAAREIYRIPKESFLRLLEDDTITATEFEILRLAVGWMSMNEGSAGMDILTRIRWGLISPEILYLFECVGLPQFSPEPPTLLEKSESEIETHQEPLRDSLRRRRVGEPNATLWVPLTRRPPAAFFPAMTLTKTGKKRTRRRVRTDPSKEVETSFDHSHLTWTIRAKLEECSASSCCRSRLSASLWLEEGDDGRVCTGYERDPLPIRVLANLMVWNHLGGKLHVAPIDVLFRSAGWGNGWCVRDLLDGSRYGLSDYGEVVQVAVEIREILQV